jgi:hypothetical protein
VAGVLSGGVGGCRLVGVALGAGAEERDRGCGSEKRADVHGIELEGGW